MDLQWNPLNRFRRFGGEILQVKEEQVCPPDDGQVPQELGEAMSEGGIPPRKSLKK